MTLSCIRVKVSSVLRKYSFPSSLAPHFPWDVPLHRMETEPCVPYSVRYYCTKQEEGRWGNAKCITVKDHARHHGFMDSWVFFIIHLYGTFLQYTVQIIFLGFFLRFRWTSHPYWYTCSSEVLYHTILQASSHRPPFLRSKMSGVCMASVAARVPRPERQNHPRR